MNEKPFAVTVYDHYEELFLDFVSGQTYRFALLEDALSFVKAIVSEHEKTAVFRIDRKEDKDHDRR